MEPIRDQTGVYFTKSDISLLQLRVTLRELSTTQILKTNILEMSENKSGIKMERISTPGIQQRQDFHEERLIKWQEKILSENEAIVYERSKFKKGKFEKYHKMAVSRKRKKPSRIFTYIDKDNVQMQIPDVISSEEKRESLINRFNEMSISGDQDEETEEKDRMQNVFYFYIMADVAPKDSLGDNRDDHKILCKIKYEKQGQLTFNPDVNAKTQTPYRIEGLIKGNNVYEYTLEVVSPTGSSNYEKTFQKKVTRPRIRTSEEPEFQKLATGETRFVYAGEILRGYYFPEECGPIYIHFQLDLPTDWSVEGEMPVCGISEVSYPVVTPSGPVYHFSIPLHFSILRKHQASGWPCLLFSALSKGWLTNDRDQGFAHFTLPYPGNSNNSSYEVNMWRPSQTTVSSKLSRHFLGGIHLYRDSTYLNPSQGKVKTPLFSRLGFKTESSGTLELRLYSILQSNLDINSQEALYFTEDYSSFHPATLAVIKAFQKSFMKLRAAQQK